MPTSVSNIDPSVLYVLNRLINDEEFRKSFQDDPTNTLNRVDLTPEQRAALAKINVKELMAATHNLRDLTKAAIGSIYI
jgi:hypothetical protein